MKKLIIGACMSAVLVLGSTSCGCGEKCNVNNDSIVPVELVDSLSLYFGINNGIQTNENIRHMVLHDGSTPDVTEYLKGMQSVMSRKHNPAYILGVKDGERLAEELYMMELAGIELDRDIILAKIREYVRMENIDISQSNQSQIIYESLINRIGNIFEQRDKMRAQDAAKCTKNPDCEAK